MSFHLSSWSIQNIQSSSLKLIKSTTVNGRVVEQMGKEPNQCLERAKNGICWETCSWGKEWIIGVPS
jgi:hypothetical protein